MGGYIPRKPTGNSPFAMFCIAIWEYLWGGKFPFIDSDTVKVNRIGKGYSFSVATSLPTKGTGGRGGAINFVGEYDPGRTYSVGQIVIISMGSNAGTYCYINSAPSAGHSPFSGGGWFVQLPQGQLGLWM